MGGDFRFELAVGLGGNCRPRHHVKRVVGRLNSRSGIFDNQITPPEAVVEYFRRDFRGLFEKSDLSVRGGDGVVINNRLGTAHPHEFPSGDIDTDYETARSRHDYLCAKMRTLKELKGPFLFVIWPETTPEIENELRRYFPDTSFRFIAIDDRHIECEPGPAGMFEPQAPFWNKRLAEECRLKRPLSEAIKFHAKRFGRHLARAEF